MNNQKVLVVLHVFPHVLHEAPLGGERRVWAMKEFDGNMLRGQVVGGHKDDSATTRPQFQYPYSAS